MKTTILKNNGETIRENSYLNPVRQLKNENNNGVCFAFFNISYGEEIYCWAYDLDTMKIIEEFDNMQLKDITNETLKGLELINFIKNYSK